MFTPSRQWRGLAQPAHAHQALFSDLRERERERELGGGGGGGELGQKLVRAKDWLLLWL